MCARKLDVSNAPAAQRAKRLLAFFWILQKYSSPKHPLPLHGDMEHPGIADLILGRANSDKNAFIYAPGTEIDDKRFYDDWHVIKALSENQELPIPEVGMIDNGSKQALYYMEPELSEMQAQALHRAVSFFSGLSPHRKVRLQKKIAEIACETADLAAIIDEIVVVHRTQFGQSEHLDEMLTSLSLAIHRQKMLSIRIAGIRYNEKIGFSLNEEESSHVLVYPLALSYVNGSYYLIAHQELDAVEMLVVARKGHPQISTEKLLAINLVSIVGFETLEENLPFSRSECVNFKKQLHDYLSEDGIDFEHPVVNLWLDVQVNALERVLCRFPTLLDGPDRAKVIQDEQREDLLHVLVKTQLNESFYFWLLSNSGAVEINSTNSANAKAAYMAYCSQLAEKIPIFNEG